MFVNFTYISQLIRSISYNVPENLTYNFIKNSPERFYPKILKAIFKKYCGYNLNLFFPKTFNEKINYLKLYDDNRAKTFLTDKLEVRNFIKDKIPARHIKELYAVYDSFDDINPDLLPETFFLKMNHGCKMQVLIENKEYFYKNREKLKKNFENWSGINYAFISGFELQYKDIKPKIFAEQVVKHPYYMMPVDVEIYCFNGIPKLTAVRCIIEDMKSGVSLYSTEEGLLPYSISDNEYNNIKIVPLPKYYEDMLENAKKLSKGFKFVRVDFLSTTNNYFFGEMTFSPFSGFCTMPDKELDKMMSKWLVL